MFLCCRQSNIFCEIITGFLCYLLLEVFRDLYTHSTSLLLQTFRVLLFLVIHFVYLGQFILSRLGLLSCCLPLNKLPLLRCHAKLAAKLYLTILRGR